jgi:4-amino-4-deoxychorismate lyase
LTLLALAVEGRGVVDPSAPVVFADDEGFLRGRAAFETARVYGGRPFRLDKHLERLAGSAARLGLPPPDLAALERLALDAIAAAGEAECSLRIYFTPGREGSGRPAALAFVQTLPPWLDELRDRGLRLVGIPFGVETPSLIGGAKASSYALNMAAVDEAKRRGADDALFLGADGVVLEAPTSNIWWRRDRTLFTPSLRLGILPGVTRATLLELAPGLCYRVEEGSYRLEDVAAADEAFTSASVREVMPVVELDGASIPRDAAVDELQAALRAAAGAGMESRATG